MSNAKIRNLKEERTIVWADSIDIDVHLSAEDTQRLGEFFDNMPIGSSIDVNVIVHLSNGVELSLPRHMALIDDMNKTSISLTKRRWWTKILSG